MLKTTSGPQVLRSVLGTAEVVQLRYAELEVLEAAVHNPNGADSFRKPLRRIDRSTNSWIRDFAEPAYWKAWDIGLPLFGG